MQPIPKLNVPKHPVIIRFDKRKMPRILSDKGNELSELTQWCVDNVGLTNYAWKKITSMEYGMVCYYFNDPDHATLFKLTWGHIST